jgi:hypothetical protein
MRNKFTFALIGLILLTIVSCKKDNSNSGNTNKALEGQWTFVSMSAKTQSTQQYTQSGTVYKTVTVSNYTTTNNSGVVTISADSMIATGLAYSVATTAEGYDYQDGQLIDSVQAPFNFSLPATNSSSKYQSIGTDSLYFPGGGFISIAGSSAPQQSVGSGAKYVISGNTLTMTTYVTQTSTQTVSGVPISVTDQGTEITTLSKQ